MFSISHSIYSIFLSILWVIQTDQNRGFGFGFERLTYTLPEFAVSFFQNSSLILYAAKVIIKSSAWFPSKLTQEDVKKAKVSVMDNKQVKYR